MPRVKLPIKLLYLDIETTPNEGTFWSLFQKFISINELKTPSSMLCWAAKWEGEKGVTFRRYDDPDFITKLYEMLDECDAVCHYNGKKFDIKHINREFVTRGMGPPSPYTQIDLLTEVRKNFSLPSYKLDYVCRAFGLGAKVKHAGIELWYGCMENNKGDWKVMEKYNRKDVVLLPKLYAYIKPWIKTHPNVSLWQGSEKPTCGKCGSTHLQKRGTYKTAATIYQRYHCQTCGEWQRSRKKEQTPETLASIK